MYLEYMKGGKTIRELARGNGSISLRRAEAVIRLKHVELEMRMVRLSVVVLCCGCGVCSWRSPLRNKTCFYAATLEYMLTITSFLQVSICFQCTTMMSIRPLKLETRNRGRLQYFFTI